MALAGVTPMTIDAAAAIAAAAAAVPAATALAAPPPVAASLQVPGVPGVPAALPGALPVMVPSLSGAGVVVPNKPKDDSDDDRDNMPLSKAFGGAALAKPIAAVAAAQVAAVAAAQVAAAAAAASSSSAAGTKRKRDSGKDKKSAKAASPAGGARGNKRGAAAKAAAAIADNDESDASDSDGSDDDGKRKKKGPAKKKAKKGDDGSSDDEMEQEDDDEDGGKKKGGSKKEKPMDAEERKRISEMIRNASEYEMLAEAVPLQPTMGANKWWNRERNKKVKWETLEHNGMLFHEPYQPHGVKLKYDGKEIELTTDEEEIATYYAAMLNTEHVKNATFNKNFFRDWTKVLKKSGKDKIIRDLDKVDFTPIAKHIAADREEKKLERKRPEVRKALKKEKDRLNEIYGFAIVDGYREKVANYKVEPPGLFRGRGAHPKTGTLKRRIKPEDVTINIGKGVKIPRAPDGHTWKGILHNQAVTWLAYYNDTFGDFKYIWLAASSRFKGASDLEKYEKARKLKDYIDQIRANYDKEMSHKNIQVRQRATAIYLIDVLALRVGNEKDKSEVADTVGCCSLRVEHLTFTEEGMKVKFDFLGKDSMRYENEVTVKEAVFKNLRDFCSGKKKDEDIFDRLTTAGLNDHLKTIMPGLTAKVFRTYNASITLENELNKANHQINIHDTAADKILHYHKANREVAILCNHQRSAPKGFDVAMQSLLDTQKDLENLRDDLTDHIAYLEKGRGPKPVRRQQPKKAKVKEEGAAGAAAAAAAGAGADAKKKSKKEDDDGEPKLQKLPDDVDKARAALKRVELKLDAHEKKIEMKQDSKTVALGTAKINYMDPRITVAWCKAKHVPIEKIFNKSLLSKFPWAMEVPATWTF